MVGHKRALRCFILILLTGAASHAQADLLFEGYAKVLLGGKHVGYAIQRYEFDVKKKEFLATTFLKTKPDSGNLTESTQARASADLKPLSYKYTSAVGDKAKLIDAKFSGDNMTLTIVEGGSRRVLPARKIPKGTFLSNYLGYVMLQSKGGMKTGVKYNYKAIAEEDGGLYDGEAFIKSEENMNGVAVFKILNTFMIGTPNKAEFISYVTAKGEVIGTRSPVQDITTELVGTMQEATSGLPVNNNTLTQLFGGIPQGQENAVARKSGGAPLGASSPTKSDDTKATPTKSKQDVLKGAPSNETEVSPKKEGVPQGQGITVKGATPAPAQKIEQ